MTPIEQQKQQDKIEHKQRLAVKSICNKLLAQFSFKNIKTWADVYRQSGYDSTYTASHFRPEELSKLIDINELRLFCKKLQDDLESKIKDKHEFVQQPDSNITAYTVTGELADDTSTNKQEKIELPSSNIENSIIKVKSYTVESNTGSSTRDESGFNNSNDYGLQPSPSEKAFLFWFQKKAAKETYDKIVVEGKRAVMILASTGTGKTFIEAAIDRRLKDIHFADDKTWGHVNTLAITRASVVEQTKRVFKNLFSINPVTETEVTNIEQLRCRAGQIWIQNKTVIQSGEEVEIWVWKPMINPAVLYVDECQSVKNESSTQHKILLAYSELPNTYQVYISATPFTRVSEAKAFAVATHKDISELTGLPAGTCLTAATWQAYADAISYPSAPDEYNEAAVERLMKDLNDYIVQVKGVRWQFNAKNSVEIIDFESPETEKEYRDAWEKYLARKAKLEETVTDNPRFQAMIELGIFLAAAEYCKIHTFAERMYRDVQNGKAAVLACKFKKTIIGVTKILHDKYGVSRDDISLIWGGGQTKLTAKQKLKAKIREKEELFKEAGVTMADMNLDEVEDRVLEDLPVELRLGSQSKDERQKEIDRFQSGKSLYCIYTYKAGGVGLSLHHSDELTKQKVRRQKNGYAIVEDIPNIPTRPRKVTVGPTWSPIDLVQGCGRAPRLTSLSDTEQTFLYYRGTVEEEQAFVVTHRLRCLSKVVRQHEAWQELITNHEKAKELSHKIVEDTSKYETDEPQIDMPSEVEDDED